MLPRIFPGIPFFHGHHTAYVSHRRARDVESLSGAAVMVRRRAFEEVGGFDEGFFFYAEESDLFARLRGAGWRVRFRARRARRAPRGRRELGSRTARARPAARRRPPPLRPQAPRSEKGNVAPARALRWGARIRWALAHLQPGRRGRDRRERFADPAETARTG
jgi:cellulose synthase/poly-beta-1,6-N-acetylglucosamine synthase-like glycosyltransferase